MKISAEERKLLNYKGFPYINLAANNELEWWMDRSEYDTVTKGNFNGVVPALTADMADPDSLIFAGQSSANVTTTV
ncbi:hypothetical protein D3C87_2167990 [compost metagenome]